MEKVFISPYLKVLEVILRELREPGKLGQRRNCLGLGQEESSLAAEQWPHGLGYSTGFPEFMTERSIKIHLKILTFC